MVYRLNAWCQLEFSSLPGALQPDCHLTKVLFDNVMYIVAFSLPPIEVEEDKGEGCWSPTKMAAGTPKATPDNSAETIAATDSSASTSDTPTITSPMVSELAHVMVKEEEDRKRRDGNDNQQLFQQAAAYAAYQTNPGMKNLTVSINRAEMVPSDPEIDPDPANQTQELIVSIQRSKRAVQLVEESSNDTGGQQIELNGEGRDKPILEQPSTAEDISVVGTAIGSSHEIGQVADDEPEGDQLPTSESDYSNQHAEEKEPEDVVHMQQPISLPHDFPPVDTNRASPSISEQVQFTNLSPGSTQLPPPLADDLQPSSSSSLPSSKPAQPLSASPTGDVQPSYYVQALPTEKELLSPLNSAPLTADISQPSSSDQPMELQPSSSMSPPLKLPPISSPPNTSLSESPVIGAPQPDTINQEPAVSELIPTARSLVSPTGNQDKIPQSSGTACLSESEQSSSQPCSLEGEEMEVSGETTEQAVTEETTRQESSSLCASCINLNIAGKLLTGEAIFYRVLPTKMLIFLFTIFKIVALTKNLNTVHVTKWSMCVLYE